MHASLVLCLMMVGGSVAPSPEPEIVDVPLAVTQWYLSLNKPIPEIVVTTVIDPGSPPAMQEMEWKANTQKRRTLPRVPTLNTDDNSRVGSSLPPGRYVPPTNPNAPQRPQPLMPMSPTDPGNVAGGMPMSQQGMGAGQGGYFGQGSSGQASAPNRPTTYDPNSVSFGKPVSNMGERGIQTTAPGAAYTPRASDTMSGIYNNANVGYLGVPANPMLNNSIGGADKPFSDYQRPSGYSPWMSLYNTPTNNGTVSTYSSSIQPQIQQQQYNRQTAEQIQGIRNTIVSPQVGSTPGMVEMPVSGAGLVNPNAVINYGYFPQR